MFGWLLRSFQEGKSVSRGHCCHHIRRGNDGVAGPQSAPAVLSAVIESHTYYLHGSWSAAED